MTWFHLWLGRAELLRFQVFRDTLAKHREAGWELFVAAEKDCRLFLSNLFLAVGPYILDLFSHSQSLIRVVHWQISYQIRIETKCSTTDSVHCFKLADHRGI